MLRPTGVFTVVSIVPFLLLIVQIILFLTQIRVSQRNIRLKSRDCILVRSMSCLYADKPLICSPHFNPGLRMEEGFLLPSDPILSLHWASQNDGIGIAPL